MTTHRPPPRLPIPLLLLAAAAAPAARPSVHIIDLAGSGTQMGTAQVRQLGPAIHTLHDQYLNPFMQSGVAKFVALSEANAFEAQLRPEHRAEVAALAAASHTDEREAMLGQCFLDIAQLSGCSTVALAPDASPDGVARFGRNLDFWSLNVADKYTTLFVVHGDAGRYAYASVGWPGMIGVLSGMNEHGLCLANMEVPRPVRPPTAMPYPLLYRTVLERCKTVDEAIRLLQATPRQTANNLMLMDAAGDRAVAEITPDAVHVRRPHGTAALISTNHQRDQDADTPGRCDRYDYLHATAAAEFGHVDEPAVTDLLRHVGRRGTLQSMVFEPAHRVLYLAAGEDATHRPYQRIDLRPYFQPTAAK